MIEGPNKNTNKNFLFSNSGAKKISLALVLTQIFNYSYLPGLIGSAYLLNTLSPKELEAQTIQSDTTYMSQIPAGFSFSRNLSFGNTVEPDIKYLQIILNSDTRTIVSETGAGSNEMPTSYFGQKTRDAVMRFQSIYASEILTPAGLQSPTGTVGQFTRNKLNQILMSQRNLGSQNTINAVSQNSQINQFNSQSTSTATTSIGIPNITTLLSTTSRPVIESIIPATSRFMNQVITITGKNFSDSNSIVTNLGTLERISTSSPNTISFIVGQLPNYLRAFNLYKGQNINLLIRVRNRNGTSNEELRHIIQFPSSASPQVTQDPALLDVYSELQSNNSNQNSNSTNNNSESNDSGSVAGTVALAAGAVAAGLAVGAVANKATEQVLDNFGGIILKSTICSCSPGSPTLLTVQNFNPLMKPIIELMYIPGVSRLAREFNIWTPGVYTVGGMIKGGPECLTGAKPACTVAGVAQYTVDPVRGIGTSNRPPGI